MRKLGIRKSTDRNFVDDMTDAIVNNMIYSDSNFEYPNFDKAKSDDGVMAEWFYPINNGQNDFSELTAIHMYTSQDVIFENIGELMLGIALTEMKHYAKLSDFITKIGGRINQRFNNSEVVIGKNSQEAIDIAIETEEKTLSFYDKLVSKISNIEETNTTKIALQLLSKLIADEIIHCKLLKNKKAEMI